MCIEGESCFPPSMTRPPPHTHTTHIDHPSLSTCTENEGQASHPPDPELLSFAFCLHTQQVLCQHFFLQLHQGQLQDQVALFILFIEMFLVRSVSSFKSCLIFQMISGKDSKARLTAQAALPPALVCYHPRFLLPSRLRIDTTFFTALLWVFITVLYYDNTLFSTSLCFSFLSA